ncbi:MAG: peptidase, imelysin family protein, partial [Gammaproteobacteria bacterium]|nr:peptidase, imelysin family protein [Gammaproteobacteria bacterium]
MKQVLFQKLLTFSAAAILLSACGGGGNGDNGGKGSVEDELASEIPFNLQNAQKLLKTNADIAYATYSDSVDTAVDLKNAITAFEGDRSQDNLDAAKRAWLIAREPYGQTEVYRFRLSPIDSTDYQSEDG